MELVVLILLLLAVAGAQNWIYRHFAFHNLKYTCTLSQKEQTEGGELELVEVVENRKPLPLAWLKAELTTSKWLELSQLQSLVTDHTRFLSSFFTIKGYQRITRKWQVKCLKRGVFTIEKAILVSTDLLGSAMLSRSVPAGSSVTVLPRALDLEQAFVSASLSAGDILVRRDILPDPFYISGVREYTERDPVNRIHWAATAKAGCIMAYHNDYTSNQSQTVILNMQTREFANAGSVNTEALETAIRACAALFQSTLDAGVPLRFLANTKPGLCTEEFWGGEHLHGLLLLLARLELESGEHFPFFLSSLYSEIASTDIALVTSYLDEEILGFARDKAYAGVHVRLFVIDIMVQETREGLLEICRLREDCHEKE